MWLQTTFCQVCASYFRKMETHLGQLERSFSCTFGRKFSGLELISPLVVLYSPIIDLKKKNKLKNRNK